MFSILLQAGAAAPAKPNMIAQFFPFILMFGIIYFLMIRPNQKKQKALQAMLDDLKINDVVVTAAGIIGKVVNIKKDKNIIVLRVDETTNTRLEFQRGAITGIIESNE